MTVVAFVVGLFAWSVVEYGLHRTQGHGGRDVRLRRFRAQHLQHHLDPTDFGPLHEVVVGGLASWGLASLLGLLVFGTPGLAYGVGYLVGYSGYEVLHRLVHTERRLPFFMERVRVHHLAHHKDPSGRYGITTTVWDTLLGTR